jgi:hypothetical protein
MQPFRKFAYWVNATGRKVPSAQVGHVGHHVLVCESVFKLLRIDADGKCGDTNQRPILLYPIWSALEPQDASAGGDEVPGVVISVEANEVCLENTTK